MMTAHDVNKLQSFVMRFRHEPRHPRAPHTCTGTQSTAFPDFQAQLTSQGKAV